MTDRPIIFSGPMVRALLDGKKTQTRRLRSSPLSKCEVGDRLYVREAWRAHGEEDCDNLASATSTCTGPEHIMFSASADEAEQALFKFRPSIHMPRWASRLTLRVTRVRYEHLRAISREDARAEGIYALPRDGSGSSVERFSNLWDSLHTKPDTSWADNPTVTALTFEVIRKNIDQVEQEA